MVEEFIYTFVFEADGGELQEALGEWTGHKTVPNVFIGGKHIGGCDGKFICFLHSLAYFVCDFKFSTKAHQIFSGGLFICFFYLLDHRSQLFWKSTSQVSFCSFSGRLAQLRVTPYLREWSTKQPIFLHLRFGLVK